MKGITPRYVKYLLSQAVLAIPQVSEVIDVQVVFNAQTRMFRYNCVVKGTTNETVEVAGEI